MPGPIPVTCREGFLSAGTLHVGRSPAGAAISFGFLTTRLVVSGILLAVASPACGQQVLGPSTAVDADSKMADGEIDTADVSIATSDVVADAVLADALDPADAGGADSKGAAETLADTDAKDAGDASEVANSADTFDPASVPNDVTWLAPAWENACVPKGATATTLGPVGPPPKTCATYDCALCGPSDKCTCDGDGNTGCAWTPIASLPFPLLGASHAWGDGKLYLWGGFNNWIDVASPDPMTSWGHPQTVEIWDPATNAWSVTAHAPVLSMDFLMPVAFGAGKVFVGGSNPAVYQSPSSTATVDLPWGPTFADHAMYDVAMQTWTPMPDKGDPGACGPFGPMVFAKSKLVVASCANSVSAEPGNPLGPAAAFDPVGNEWTALPPITGFPAKLADWRPEAVLGALAVGWLREAGTSKQIALALFDTDSWSWTFVDPVPANCANDPVQAIAFDLIAFGEKLLAISTYSGLAFYLNPSSGTWQPLRLPTWVGPAIGQPVWTGSAFVFWNSFWKPWSSSYDPLTGVWRQLSTTGQLLPRGYGVATAQPGTDRVIYIGGGGVMLDPFADGAAILVP